MLSRTTTLLALIQIIIIIVAGFFKFRFLLKLFGPGKPHNFSNFGLFFCNHGYLLLALPLLWVIYAVWAEQEDSGLLSYRLACTTGLAIAVMTGLLFIFTVARAAHQAMQSQSSGGMTQWCGAANAPPHAESMEDFSPALRRRRYAGLHPPGFRYPEGNAAKRIP